MSGGDGRESAALAAPFAPYALHYQLPQIKNKRDFRDKRTRYGIPLPPTVSPSQYVVDIEQSNNNFPSAPYIPSSPRGEVRISSPRTETIMLPPQEPNMSGLNDRLNIQDRNIELLLDRAIRIKEELVSALGRTNNTLQEERFARELLQQHVNIMVLLCQKLSQQIEVIAILLYLPYLF